MKVQLNEATTGARAVRRQAPDRRPRRPSGETAHLEGQIEAREQTLKQLSAEIDAARGDAARVMSLGIQYAQIESELEQLIESWGRTAGGDGPA